jgi:putative hydrolase of the HAD superfamily
MLGRASAAEVWDSVGRQLGIPPEDLTRLRLDFFADDRIDEGLMSFVRGLRRRVRVGLISNAWADVRPLLDSPWAIADAFDPLVISAEVGMVKPHEPIFRLALDQAGVGPSEAAFVDDLPENVEAAIRLGMHGVLFRSTEQAQAEVEALLREETTGD